MVYDSDKINELFILGNDANWIKNLKFEFQLHNKLKVIQGLDKFHFKQALNHITKNNEINNILYNCILKDNKIDFIKVIDSLINSNPLRKDKITEKSKYVLNNWAHINIKKI